MGQDFFMKKVLTAFYGGCIVALTMKVRPSPKLLLLVNKVHGSTRAAAEAWDIQHVSLQRFLNDEGGLSGESIAAILSATRLSFEDLFEVQKEAAR